MRHLGNFLNGAFQLVGHQQFDPLGSRSGELRFYEGGAHEEAGIFRARKVLVSGISG